MTDATSWWTRTGSKEKGFRYLKADGTPLRSEAALRRIRALAIPPAWTDVHIATRASARIQAWGRDAAGRKQYRYHTGYRRSQDRRKWDRILEYARVIPKLRELTNRDLQRSELDRRKVLATVVRLMSRAWFRVGSERYAVENRTFGICTLRKSHVEIRDTTLIFTYAGKRRIDQRRVVADTPLAEILNELKQLPGRRLFRYRDESGRLRDVTAQDVNEYIRELLGRRYTSKDLRTFGGTVRAATILADLGPPRNATEAKKNVLLTARLVAMELGNTPAISRASYIHPSVFERYAEDGLTMEPLMRSRERPVRKREPASYYSEEAALMRFLERYG